MRNDIVDRVHAVMRSCVSERRRLKELEEETGIPHISWKNVWTRRQRPTLHMVEAISRRWPQYAFWLVTGITDETNGHTAPPNTWTCGQPLSLPEVEAAATEYFELKILAQDSIYGMSGAAEGNYVEKKNPSAAELDTARKNECKSENPEVQALIDSFFGTEPKVYEKKYGDLDYAIARIAFERRLSALKDRFFDFDAEPEYFGKYLALLGELEDKRRTTPTNTDA